MKKIFGYMIVTAVLAMPAMSFAAEFRAGDQPSVRADEQIVNDLYIAGGSVTSAGNVTGDLVTGGGNIIISGNVGADVVAGGGNVSILSNVGDDVRVGGGTIVISGSVGGDVIAGGGEISLGGPGVGGDVTVGGGNIRIDAPVMGNLWIGGGSVYINAPIAGDIKIEADKVTLGSSAVISGNMIYKAKKELVMEAGAVVNGKITFEQRKGKMIPHNAFAAIFSAFLIWKFFALLACALLFGLVFRRYNMEMVAYATRRPLLEIFRGLVILVAMPIISILLLVTVIGIPLGILGLIGYVALMIFSCIVAPIILGSVVYGYFSKKDRETSWKTILLGVVLYSLLGLVPFIGWLAQFFLMLASLGCIASLKWRIVKEWR